LLLYGRVGIAGWTNTKKNNNFRERTSSNWRKIDYFLQQEKKT
jgi:hypothetical protein